MHNKAHNPSVRFDLQSQDFMQNPFATFAAMRAAGDVVPVKLPLIGQVWMTTTHQAASEMLKANDVFVQDPRKAGKTTIPGLQWWMPKSFRLLANNMLQKDEPDHRRLRGLVDQAFHRRGIAEMAPRIETIANDLIDQIPTDKPVDLIQLFARPFPLAVISELLGLPAKDRAKFMSWCEGLTGGTSTFNVILALPGIGKLLRYLRAQIADARKNPREGLISELVRAEQEGDQLSDDELLSMVFLLLFAGHETTTHLISGGLHTLLRNPEQKARMVADWDRIGLGVEELLRFVSPVQVSKPRFVSKDTNLAGQDMKRGELVMACLGSANSDPAQFTNPETLDVFRQPNRHLGFGSGIHFCLGIQLARAEVAIALRTLLTRFPNLALAKPDQDLQWRKRFGLRAIKELPILLEPASTSTKTYKHAA